jgi:protein-histidine pros-kinase
LDVETDINVVADRRALTQILLNLMSNAIKFTETGQVKLEVQRSHNGRDRVLFVVSDTGPGITDGDQAKLFQAFEQGGSSATRRHDGTGLGLYISQKLAATLGGDITCESELGAGSRFTLMLDEA